jgi:hypothetical protein
VGRQVVQHHDIAGAQRWRQHLLDIGEDGTGSERLTGAILDRLTHHVHILEMNGESFRLRQSRTDAVACVEEWPHTATG